MVSLAGVKQSVIKHRVELGVAAGLTAIGIGSAVALAKVRKKKRKNTVSRTRKSVGNRRTPRRTASGRKRKRRTPYTAGKRRDTSRRRIRYTKNGQPYVIVASGKARFISKKSAKTSRKRSGGRY